MPYFPIWRANCLLLVLPAILLSPGGNALSGFRLLPVPLLSPPVALVLLPSATPFLLPPQSFLPYARSMLPRKLLPYYDMLTGNRSATWWTNQLTGNWLRVPGWGKEEEGLEEREKVGGERREGIKYDPKAREKEVSKLSRSQQMEFDQIGNFQVGQIQSQMDYSSVLKNYDMNLKFGLSKVGLSKLLSERSDTNNSLCYDDLGCVDISEKWYGLTRPINLLPLDRKVINTQFILRTRRNPEEVIVRATERAEWKTSITFNSSNPTKFIVHGFIDTGFEAWVKDMAKAFLEVEDSNVFVVDWGGGSLPLYSQAAANTRLVGLELAHIIKVLMEEYNVTADTFHIVGHSLGSHIAGYAGQEIEGLGRITGLDPAEPLFQSMPEFVRLDPADATFVDVIHTDTNSILLGGYGMETPCGHADFYPNGGHEQPGCSLLELASLSSIAKEELPSADKLSRRLFACQHNRANFLFTDSIRSSSTCPLVGQLCGSYSKYQAGSCHQCGDEGEKCALMGYPARKHRSWKEGQTKRFYLETGVEEPFCKYSYLLEVQLGLPNLSSTWVQGSLKTNMYGDKGEILDHVLIKETKTEVLTHGENRKFKISLDKDLGSVSIVHLYWKYDHEVDPFQLGKICVMFCKDSLYINNIKVTYLVTDRTGVVRSVRRELCAEDTAAGGGGGGGSQSAGLLGFLGLDANSKKSHTVVKSGEWKLFYSDCNST